MNIEISRRLSQLPPYLFVEIDRAKKKARDQGRDIIDLGVGDPDMPTPRFIIKALHRASLDPKTHHYSMDEGLSELRIAFSQWYNRRFGVNLDPDTEVLPLIGSKEGIAHLPLAFVNPGDICLVPDPCYPPYRSGAIFAGGEVHEMPLVRENSFIPDLKHINAHLLHKVKIIYVNYPNNPTGATCTKGFYQELARFASRHGIIVVSDAAYSELYFSEGSRPASFLSVDGAKEIGIEFHSLSKTFSMTGWRLGFACGNADIIKGLARVKSNIDSGAFMAIQKTGVTALKNIDRVSGNIRRLYKRRLDVLTDGLNDIGWKIPRPEATFYLWAPVIKRFTSASFAKELLERADVVVTPGNGFGRHGEGYVRMAVTVGERRLTEAVRRIKKIL